MEPLDLPPNCFFIILTMKCSQTLEPKMEELTKDVLHLNINKDDVLSMQSSNTINLDN